MWFKTIETTQKEGTSGHENVKLQWISMGVFL